MFQVVTNRAEHKPGDRIYSEYGPDSFIVIGAIEYGVDIIYVCLDKDDNVVKCWERDVCNYPYKG